MNGEYRIPVSIKARVNENHAHSWREANNDSRGVLTSLSKPYFEAGLLRCNKVTILCFGSFILSFPDFPYPAFPFESSLSLLLFLMTYSYRNYGRYSSLQPLTDFKSGIFMRCFPHFFRNGLYTVNTTRKQIFLEDFS